MVKMLLDIPENLMTEVTIYKARTGIKNKTDAVIQILSNALSVPIVKDEEKKPEVAENGGEQTNNA